MTYKLDLEDYIDQDLWQKIRDISREKGITKEMLVVEALQDYLRSIEDAK